MGKSLCSSSHFDYHFKKLKEEEYYTLTSKGTSIITSLDGVSLKETKKPVVCAFCLVQREDGKILMSIRNKQPFLGFLNIPGGKIEYGNFSHQDALRELQEETGLSCDTSLKIISEKITYNVDEENKVEHHIIGYFYLGTNPKGELLTQTREGKNFWMEAENLSHYTRFLDLDYLVPNILTSKEIKITQIKRYRKEGKFIDISIEELN